MTRAVAFVGRSGSGKTTLIERLVPLLARAGHAVGYLKSTRHGFDMDRSGKDTDRIFRAGAERVAIASSGEGALRFRIDRKDPLRLLEEHMRGCTFLLVEGFKGFPLPKLEVRRDPRDSSVLDPDDASLVAVVAPFPDPRPLPRFPPDAVEEIARFVLDLPASR
jgi:molybdopterin-guanine dinucleotide biosynthesis protein B